MPASNAHDVLRTACTALELHVHSDDDEDEDDSNHADGDADVVAKSADQSDVEGGLPWKSVKRQPNSLSSSSSSLPVATKPLSASSAPNLLRRLSSHLSTSVDHWLAAQSKQTSTVFRAPIVVDGEWLPGVNRVRVQVMAGAARVFNAHLIPASK